MKINRDDINKDDFLFIVLTFFLGLFLIINNVFEYHCIGRNLSLSFFRVTWLSCFFMFILKHYKIIDDEYGEMRKSTCLIVGIFYVIFIEGGMGLNLIIDFTLWMKYIILFLWVVAYCFLLYTSIRKKQNDDD